MKTTANEKAKSYPITPPPFMSVPDASKYTGLSRCFLRDGCKNGSIPHIKTGNKFYINIPLMLEEMGIKNLM